MSRHSALTDELRTAIERELATGATQGVIAQRVGVSRRNLTYWLAQGKVTRQRVEPLPLPSPDPVFSVADRVAQAEPGLVGVIISAAQRGSWQAAAWILERRFPQDWARPSERNAATPTSPSAETHARVERWLALVPKP